MSRFNGTLVIFADIFRQYGSEHRLSTLLVILSEFQV